MPDTTTHSKPFLTDVKLCAIEPARTSATVRSPIPIKATSIKPSRSCKRFSPPRSSAFLRYTMHAVAATGISSEGVKAEFKEHAKEEAEHVNQVAERINQLGGKPDFNPTGLASRSASEYGTAENLVEMIKENLIAERIAVDHYRELIRYFGNDDPGTRLMLEGILAVEEEHANDMHDLLVAHEGHPMLDK